MNLQQILAAGLTIVSLGAINLTAYAKSGKVALGDLNADGLVDAIDASVTLAVYANISTEKDLGITDEQFEAADVNHDGLVDAVDASLMLSYYAYISTGGDKSFGDYLSAPPTSTTATATVTTQTTTAKPVTTTQAQTERFVLENIAHDAGVFLTFAHKLNYDMLGGNGIYCDYGYGVTAGGDEQYLLLAVLNYGQIDDSVLQTVLGGYSAEDLKNFQTYFYKMAEIRQVYGYEVDYTKYTLNKSVGEYINSLAVAADNNNISSVAYNDWEQDLMPPEIKNHPAALAALASYDTYYNDCEYLSPNDVDDYILDEAVDNIIKIVHGE